MSEGLLSELAVWRRGVMDVMVLLKKEDIIAER